jgi:hypothetical protein
MAKKIRTTITIDMDYDSELLNYNEKLVKKIRDYINDNHFSCQVVAGDNLENSGAPINTIPSELSSEFAHPAYTRYPHLKDQVLKQKAMTDLNWDGDITVQDLADQMAEIIARKG